METVDFFVLILVVIAYLGWLLQDEIGAQPPDFPKEK